MNRIRFENAAVITMNPSREILEDTAVEVSEGKISAILPMREARNRPADKIIDCSDHLLLPGLIDSAGFGGETIGKGFYTETPELRKNLAYHLPSELRTAEFWELDQKLAALERIRSGVTTGVTLYGNEGALAGANASASGSIRIIIGTAADTPKLEDVLAGIRETGAIPAVYLDSLLQSLRGKERIHASDCMSLSSADARILQQAYTAAEQSGGRVFAEAEGFSIGLVAEHLPEVFNPMLVLLFCNGMTIRESRIVRERHVGVIHSPSHTIRYCPYSELVEMGVPVGVTPHNHKNYATGDMIQTMRKLQMIEQLRFDDLDYTPIGKQLESMTIDAAAALGIDTITGSIEIGKSADLITVDMQRPELVPWRDMPLHRFFMDGNASDIDNVMISGKFLMQGGKICHMKEQEILAQARALLDDMETHPTVREMLDPTEWAYSYRTGGR